MTRRNRKYPPEWLDDDTFTAAMVVGGVELRRYGQWCARTQGGTWRSATWVGRLSFDDLADHILAAGSHDPVPVAPVAGQLGLEFA